MPPATALGKEAVFSTMPMNGGTNDQLSLAAQADADLPDFVKGMTFLAGPVAGPRWKTDR